MGLIEAIHQINENSTGRNKFIFRNFLYSFSLTGMVEIVKDFSKDHKIESTLASKSLNFSAVCFDTTKAFAYGAVIGKAINYLI